MTESDNTAMLDDILKFNCPVCAAAAYYLRLV
jgi:hypothetical protein